MATWRDKFDGYFFSPVAAVRPWLVEKCVLVLLALDMWLLRFGAANRYDADELNLAHFAWLDWLGPTPSTGLYIGVAVLAGVLALAIAFAGLGVGWKLALVALYSYTWAMSRLDTFQHHYLLSWLLLCVAFFPRVRLADFWKSSGQSNVQKISRSPLVSAWAWVLLVCLIAIVYCYTAVAKLDRVWQSGACLQQLSGTIELLRPLENAFVQIGGEAESFWRWMARGTVLVELLIAAGYLLMPLAERRVSRWASRTFFVCWLLAIGLHVGFELAGLLIGWFSYFMMLMATASFLPAKWLERLLRPFAWTIPGKYGASRTATARRNGMAAAATLLAVTALLVMAWWSDLPGVWPAGVIAAVAFVAAMVDLKRRQDAVAMRRLPVAVLVASLLLAAAIQFGDGRSKYYPYRLAQLQRSGQFAAVGKMLPKAELYVNDNDIFGQNNLAFFFATTSEESLRDGEKAIRYALRTCELSEYGNASALDTLACAYAASGDFTRALDMVQRAKELLRNHANEPTYADFVAHERLFLAGRPYVATVRYRYQVAAAETSK